MRYSDYYDKCAKKNDSALKRFPVHLLKPDTDYLGAFECSPKLKMPEWVGWNPQTLSRMKKIDGVWYII